MTLAAANGKGNKLCRESNEESSQGLSLVISADINNNHKEPYMCAYVKKKEKMEAPEMHEYRTL